MALQKMKHQPFLLQKCRKDYIECHVRTIIIIFRRGQYHRTETTIYYWDLIFQSSKFWQNFSPVKFSAMFTTDSSGNIIKSF